ncbi:MAG: hypothetical protein IPM41_15990 [Sphingomonadales bacterium]|nr:hypothetical protein [Sphingomonadales bacterium]
MKIKTAGDLRSFLADVIVGIRDGNIDYQDATAISKVAAQINNSLAVEVNTALRLTGMGKDHPVAGTMAIGGPDEVSDKLEASPKIWCGQCDKHVSQSKADTCQSAHCKAGK